MRLEFGLSAFERPRGSLPELPCVNMFLEQAPTEAGGIVLQSRPGLEVSSALNLPAIAAIYRKDGVLAGERFAITGDKLFSGATEIGTVAGPGPWFIDGFEDRIFITGGNDLFTYDGMTLTPVSFPDSAWIRKVVVGASRLIALRSDTEKYYYSDVLSTTIDSLSFTTAESQPDRLRDVLFIDGILILFGAETVEFHPGTGNADLPFAPLEGRVFEAGIRDTGCATIFGSTFAWVTNNNRVCISDPDNIISNSGLEAKIGDSASVKLWTFWLEGAEFLALRLDTQTYVFTDRAKTWHEMASWGRTNWIPHCYADGEFGSSVAGDILRWTDDHSDFGGVLERRFRFGAPLNSGGVFMDNIQIRTAPGGTPFLTGDYLNPVVEMRLSRNAGRTWGNWKQTALGAQGAYRDKVRWIGLGMAANPGVFGEIRCVDPVPFRVSEVLMNEAWGGL